MEREKESDELMFILLFNTRESKMTKCIIPDCSRQNCICENRDHEKLLCLLMSEKSRGYTPETIGKSIALAIKETELRRGHFKGTARGDRMFVISQGVTQS